MSTLPVEFVKYLRTLFEILDKGNNGYIKISDLEEYWGTEYQLDDSVSSSLIIKRLYEMAPGNAGLLSFPRMCAGIKEAFLQVKIHKQRPPSFIQAMNFDKESISGKHEENACTIRQNGRTRPSEFVDMRPELSKYFL